MGYYKWRLTISLAAAGQNQAPRPVHQPQPRSRLPTKFRALRTQLSSLLGALRPQPSA
jgi:hypothetical protein